LSGESAGVATSGKPSAWRWGRAALGLLIGVAGSSFLAFYAYWYEINVHHAGFMPQVVIFALTPMVFFLFLLLAGVVNPLLRWALPRLALGRHALLLILGLWLLTGATCFRNLIVPVLATAGTAPFLESLRPVLKQAGISAYLRPELFLPEAEYRLFYYGVGDATEWIPPAAVPWVAWLGPMTFWLPLMVVAVVLAVALVRMMHRQWSRHELLTYPLAGVAESLLTSRSDRTLPDIFYSRAFWVGFGMTAFIYLVNGLHMWFPQVVQIPLEFEQRDLLREFPFLYHYCGTEAYSLFRGWIWPFMVGIAVLVPTEISLTSWLGYVLLIFAGGLYFMFTGDGIKGLNQQYYHAGAYVGAGLVILYLGRREYVNILRVAFTRRWPKGHPLEAGAWACRVYLLACAVLVALLVYAGMDWLVALLVVTAFSLMVVLIARLTAEIGIPWLANMGHTAQRLPYFFLGPAAIGPQSLTVMAVVAAVLDFDTSNTVAAQATTFEKLAEGSEPLVHRMRSGLGSTALLIAGLLIALGCAIFFILWNAHSFGAQQDGGTRGAVLGNMMRASEDINRMRLEGQLEKLSAVGGLGKIAYARPERRFWGFFGFGLALVVVCATLRLRFAWWPFHPLPLLLANTWCLSRLYHSFLLGWAIKVAIVKIGGGRFYSRSRPFFIGLIFGQIGMCGLWMLVDGLYYTLRGLHPPFYRYFA